MNSKEWGFVSTNSKFNSMGSILGSILGGTLPAYSWNPVAHKLAQGSLAIKKMGLGMASSVAAHNVYALSVTGDISQGFRPTPQILRAEREALQVYTCAPRHSFPQAIFSRFKDIGFKVQAGDLRIRSLAARLRAAINSDLFPRLVSQLQDTLEGDGYCIAFRWPPYLKDSLFWQLYQDFLGSRCIQRLPEDIQKTTVQNKLVQLITPDFHSEPISGIIAPRLRKWVPSLTGAEIDTSFR
eukprot:9062439-Pyramimonas_sp.AAC.1